MEGLKCVFEIGQFSGIYDKNGRPICVGDKVKGLFYFGLQVEAVCRFSPRKAAFGLEWQRGEVTEFNAFCQMCNVEYEVIGNIADDIKAAFSDSENSTSGARSENDE